MVLSDLPEIIKLFGLGLAGGISGGLALFVISLFVNLFYGIVNEG